MRSNDLFESVVKGLFLFTGVLILAFLISAIGGFFIMLLWPIVIPRIMPGLVESGAVAGSIGFWTAYWLTFMCSILFKASSSSSSKKE